VSVDQAHVDDLEDFRLWAREIRNQRIRRSLQPPLIRFWDGDWKYRGRCLNPMGFSVQINEFDSGAIVVNLPIDRREKRKTFLAYWVLDQDSRKQNVHLTFDHNGARIGGRMKTAVLRRDPEGDFVECTFAEDIDELRHVHVAANPFLPLSIVQFPRIFFLLATSIYGLKLALMMNLMRLNFTNFNFGSDPLSPSGPAGTSSFWAQSQIVVKPLSISADSSPPTILTAAMDSWWDIAEPVIDDGELFVERRRWLTGDPEPWPGAGTNFRNGTLIVDIVDKSGFRSGTSVGGNLLSGVTRVFASTTGNQVEDSYNLFTGTPDSSQYRVANWLGTSPKMPYVVYRDGEVTGIESYDFTMTAGGPGRITVGGRSMPGVNELISAAVNYLGDVVGDNLVIAGYGVGSLGSTIDTFLAPIYKDTLLAYMSVPLLGRVAQQGWGHYLETTGTGEVQAYTPSALIAMRSRRRETDPDTSFVVNVRDCGPWVIGDKGKGHWWLGDRVGATSRYMPTKVFVNRCSSLEYSYDEDTGLQLKASFGAPRKKRDPLEKMISLIGKAMSGLQRIGVLGT
jgi:hypothetical protein